MPDFSTLRGHGGTPRATMEGLFGGVRNAFSRIPPKHNVLKICLSDPPTPSLGGGSELMTFWIELTVFERHKIVLISPKLDFPPPGENH